MRRENPSLIDDYCLQLGSLLDRRQTERALTGARQNAEHAALLAEQAAREAQAADRAKTNFLANVTHELRTPLNAIIGFSEIIETGAAVGDHAAYGQYIHAAGSRLLGIVNDVLALARIEAGKLELDEQVALLGEVLRTSIKGCWPEADAKAVAIEHAPAPDHLVFLDPGKMKQVFDRLLSNAVKFTGEGGTVSAAVVITPQGEIVVTIRDTGRGIPAEHLDRVLEPFGQVEDQLTRQTEGVGLGLPLARAIVAMHGGSLTLTSEVGVGTVAQVSLPAARLRAASTEGM